MQCGEIIDKLEGLAPSRFAEDWDNVGLLAGRRDKEVGLVMLALDATDKVIAEAVQAGADMLLTHHPLIFSAVKSVNSDSVTGRRLLELLSHDICCYAMHTNFDVMGMADAAGDLLGLTDRRVLDTTYEKQGIWEGIGRIGELPKAMSLRDCAAWVKDKFTLDTVRVFGCAEIIVKKAAVCPGSGKSVIGKASALGADVLITGDIGHHEGLDAMAEGLCIIDAGHYGLEKIFVSYMETFLREHLHTITVCRAGEKAPFWVM